MKKKIIIISTVLVVLAVLIVTALLGFKLVDTIMYSSFYDIANDEFYIPDLMDGFVPQGFDYIESEKLFLVCGYMNGKEEASRVYVIDEDGDEYYYTELTDTYVEKKYTEHTGGIAFFGDYVYITGTEGIDVFALSDILDESVKRASRLGSIDTSKYLIDPAFCTVYGDQLYVGSFHDGEDHIDPEQHKLQKYATAENKIAERDSNNALMLSFTLSKSYDGDRYFVSPTPNAVYSIPDKVQGVCIIPESYDVKGNVTRSARLVVSTSYGISASNIYAYDFEKIEGTTYSAGTSKEMIGVSVPLYVVDSKVQTDALETPPMAEEIVYHDGKVWIMNESASNKYIFGKFTTGNTLFSVSYPFEK